MNERKIDEYKNRNLILYGASNQGINILNLLSKVGIKPMFFLDSDPKKYGTFIENIEVISLEEAKRKKILNEKSIIIITSMYINDILSRLQENDIKSDIEPYYYVEFVIKSFLLEYKIKEIKKIRNSYAEKRCFIIGNGPSLLSKDLDRLINEHTFGANGINLIYPLTKWRPTFYSCFDCISLNDNKYIEKFMKYKYKYIFLADDAETKKELMNSNNIIYFTRKRSGKLENPELNDNMEQSIYVYNVTAVMIEIAIYMGFKEIYLLGVDNDFGDDCKNVKHFNENYNEEVDINDDYYVDMDIYAKSVNREYELINKYAIKNNVRIYNATRGGKLEIFERVCFDKLDIV